MKILKGLHYGCPFPWPKFYCKKTTLSKQMLIQFDDSIRYDIGEDQSDVNKLFGFSYGWHHTDSDRIGFRYDIKNDLVEIVLYTYSCGKRVKTKHIYNAHIYSKLNIMLDITIDGTQRTVTATVTDDDKYSSTVKENFNSKTTAWGYTLGLYFGGNKRAPHTITIKNK